MRDQVTSAVAATARGRLVTVTIDKDSLGPGTSDQAHERLTAIHDLIEDNVFALHGYDGGPYALRLSLRNARLAFEVSDDGGRLLVTHLLSLSPFRRLLRDYLMVCESYVQAIRTASPSRIEAIDMGRRGLHDEGARLLRERLKTKIDMDFDTGRRLFTLLTALHWRG